jgi:hypothetical protein
LEVIRYIYLQLMYAFILFDHLFNLIQRDSVYNVDKYEEAKKSNQIQRISKMLKAKGIYLIYSTRRRRRCA